MCHLLTERENVLTCVWWFAFRFPSLKVDLEAELKRYKVGLLLA